MEEYTLGPWYWINQTGGGPALVYGNGDDDGGVICEASMTGKGITIWNEADAPVIAAAPVLMDALNEIARADHIDRAVLLAQEAIAKVRDR